MTRRFSPIPALLRHPASLVVALFSLSCIGDAAGPGAGRPALLQLVPEFDSNAPSGIVPIARIRIQLFRKGSTTVALDQTFNVDPNATEVDLSLSVAVFSAADTFNAVVDMLTPQGEVAFHGGPIEVVARPAQGNSPGTSQPPQLIGVQYVGVGSDASTVEITTAAIPLIMTGDELVLAAVAKKADGTVIPNTPIAWISLDPARATILNAAQSRVVGGGTRGNARIVAQLLTGPADTVPVPVQLAPATMAAASGAGQSGAVRSLLGQPLVAELKASDNGAVIGAWVKFQVTAGGGAVSAESLLTDANGRASIQWTLGATAGSQNVRATTPRLPSAQANFDATAQAGTAAYVRLAGPNNQTATVGTALANSPNVIVGDADSNAVQGATVTFTVTGGGGSVSATTRTTDASGNASVTWTLGTVAGTNTLVAALSGAAPAPADSSGDPAPAATQITFTATGTPGAAATLALTGLTSPLVGVPVSLTVTAKDQHGNTATDYRGRVVFFSNDAFSTLPGDYTFTAGDAGVRTFPGGVTFSTTGNLTVTAADATTPSITGALTVAVGGGGANTFAITGLPATTVAGPSHTITVTARDAGGSTVTSYTGTVYFTSTDPFAFLPAPYTFVPADNGTRTFTDGVALHRVGNQTVAATDIQQPGLSGTSAPVSVSHTTLAFLELTGSADSLVGGVLYAKRGVPFTVTVTARDTFLNTVPTYAGTVTFDAADQNPTLPPPYRFVTADQGTHTFPEGATLFGPDTNAIGVTDENDVGGGLLVILEGPPGGGAQSLMFDVQPADAEENQTFPATVTVHALDASANLATGFNGNVTLALGSNPSGTSLTGSVTVAAVGGVAQFPDIRVPRYGSNYTLTAASSGVTGATSAPFTMTPIGMTARWSGAVSSVITNGANWVGGVAPGSNDIVFVPASAPNYPALAAPGIIASLFVEDGATFTVTGGNQLTVNGHLHAGHSSIDGAGLVVLAGSGTVRGSINAPVDVTGNYLATDSVVIAGNVQVHGSAAMLDLGGKKVRVGGNFSTLNSGRISMMTGVGDTLDIFGNATFAGGNTTGLLTQGVIRARGNFLQTGYYDFPPCTGSSPPDTVETFFSTGTRVELIGTGAQQVGLGTPGPELAPPLVSDGCQPNYAGGSQFADLFINNPAGVTLSNHVLITGDLQVLAGNLASSEERLSVVGTFTTPASINLDALEVGDAVTVQGTFNVNLTAFVGNNQNVPAYPYQNLRVFGTGTASLTAAVPPVGNLIIAEDVQLILGGNLAASTVDVRQNSTLVLNGQTVQTADFFQVRDNARLVMNQAADLLQVGGVAYFATQANNDQLTDGVIALAGRFAGNACACTTNFVASGSHTVRFIGTGTAQQVGFDDASASRFQNVEVVNSFGLSLNTSVTVAGNLVSNPGGQILYGAGSPTLTVDGNLSTPSISVPEIRVGGTLSAPFGAFAANNTVFTGTGQTIPNLPYTSVGVTGTASISVAVNIASDLIVSGTGANLSIAAPTTVGGGFTTDLDGTLTMTSPSASLDVAGDVTFNGGETDGLLTNGTLSVGGDFSQGGSNPESFHAGGLHNLVFDGAGAQSVFFTNPGIGPLVSLSHAANITFNTPGPVTLGSDVYAHTGVQSFAGNPTIVGGGRILAGGALSLTGVTLDHVLLEWRNTPTPPWQGGTAFLSNVTFQGYPDTDNQFTIVHTGAVSPFSFTSLNFNGTPTTGKWIHATDANGTSPILTINITSPDYLAGPGNTTMAGSPSPAVVNWSP